MKNTYEQFMNLAKRDLEKVVVNSGIGRIAQQANFNEKLPVMEKEFALIVGQKPAERPARQSIAGFKMRAGNIVGIMATLRGRRMADFLMRTINVVIPRMRDFRGIALQNVDQEGNLTIGIKEHIVFPEMNGEALKVNFGIQMTLVPQMRGREKALELYKALGVPFSK